MTSTKHRSGTDRLAECAEHYGWDADQIVVKDTAPAGRVELDDPQVDRFDSIVGRERVAKQGWTDVARLTSRGAVAVNYGPGEVAQAHQVGESMSIANLSVAYDVMKRFLSGGQPTAG